MVSAGALFFVIQASAAPVAVSCTGTSGTPTAIDGTLYLTTDDVTFSGSGWCEITGAMNVASVTVDSGVTLTHPAVNTTGLDITASGSFTLNGNIDASDKGYAGGDGSTADGGGTGGGAGASWTGVTQAGGGAGHGGAGGASATKAAGAAYGDSGNPTNLGSGGGRSVRWSGAPVYGYGGAGGGLVVINATSSVAINGSIIVDGGAGLDENSLSSGGGGSGGTVNIVTDAFSGTGGSISADGGSATVVTDTGGGGGGGLVFVGYVTDTSDFLSGLTSANTTVKGSGYADGSDGVFTATVYTVPTAPTFSAPVNNTYQNSVNPTLTGSTYSDNGSGHLTTDWVVSADSGFSTSEWSKTTSSASESIVVNTTNGTFAGALTGETALASYTTYYARARYTNAAGNSSWSSTLTFTTAFTGTPSTQTWAFDTSGNYTMNATNVEVAGGNGQLVDLGGSTYAVSNGPDSTTKRRPIAVTNNVATVFTNHQVKLEVTYDADMQADFDDIRFTTSDGVTEIDYWIESKTDSATADVWVEIPSLASLADTDIFIYYGNAGLSSESSITNTFVFGDDFDDGSIDQVKWGGTQTNFTESSGYLNGGNTSYRILSNDSFTGNYVLETRHYVTTDQSHIAAGFWGSTTNGYTMNFLTTERPHVRSDSTWDVGAWAYMNNWIDITVTAIGASSDIVMYNEGTLATHTMTNSNGGLSSEYVAFGTRHDDADTGLTYNANWDWVFVREYASTEPTVAIVNDANSPEVSVAGYSGINIIPASGGSHPYADSLYTFAATLSAGSADTVVYQIGFDAAQDGTVDGWYYHDGTNWTLASVDSTDNDTATVVNTYLPSFIGDAGAGDIYFKAFLVSDGSQFVGLDSITLEYNANPTTSTIGAQTYSEDVDVIGSFDLDDYFTDVGDTLTYSIIDTPESSLLTATVNGDGTVDIALVADQNGSDTIQFRATDQAGANVNSNSVAITVNAVNDVPSFTKGADPSTVTNTTSQTISGWATGMSKGPSNESGQTLSFNVSNDNNALFSVQPDVDEASGDLTFTPAAASGSVTVTVSLADDGGTANGGVDESAQQTFTFMILAAPSGGGVPTPATGPAATVTTSMVLTPNGGEHLSGNSAFTITWLASGDNLATISIYSSTDNGQTYTLIASGEANDGSYVWTTPNISTSQARVRVDAVTASGGTLISDASNGSFSISSVTVVPEPETSEPELVGPVLAQMTSPEGEILDIREGSLFRGVELSGVYQVMNGTRYVFPNEETFFTHYADFSGVQQVNDDQLRELPSGGRMIMATGSLIKVQSDNRVFVVQEDGLIRHIPDEPTAIAMYGTSWASLVHDVSVVFWFDYTVGDSLPMI